MSDRFFGAEGASLGALVSELDPLTDALVEDACLSLTGGGGSGSSSGSGDPTRLISGEETARSNFGIDDVLAVANVRGIPVTNLAKDAIAR